MGPDTELRKDTDTPLPYSLLIFKSLLSAPEKKLRVRDIYCWFKRYTTRGQSQRKNWKNSIRYNLTANPVCLLCVISITLCHILTQNILQGFELVQEECSPGKKTSEFLAPNRQCYEEWHATYMSSLTDQEQKKEGLGKIGAVLDIGNRQ